MTIVAERGRCIENTRSLTFAVATGVTCVVAHTDEAASTATAEIGISYGLGTSRHRVGNDRRQWFYLQPYSRASWYGLHNTLPEGRYLVARV